MTLSPERIPSSPRRRAPTLPQPRTPEWSTALAPSQQRAADRRSQLRQRRFAERLLRGLAR